jgi:clan AA aspartic protease
VTGKVDDHNRALVDIEVRSIPNALATTVTVWIDTAFDGHLVFPRTLVQSLGLESLVDTEAVLADGTKVTLEAFVCYLDWFSQIVPLQVIANDGKTPLLGTALLDSHILHIDYASKQLTLV